MMVHFRKRFSEEDLKRINELIAERGKAMVIEAMSGLLKKPDRLQRKLFQRSKPVKLAAYRAIDDCYNC
jgi:ppGpp synthetase/RelA/SpoT-type nucleotidyltranferase